MGGRKYDLSENNAACNTVTYSGQLFVIFSSQINTIPRDKINLKSNLSCSLIGFSVPSVIPQVTFTLNEISD